MSNKLTYNEIREILENSEISLEDFAYNEIPYSEFSEKALASQQTKEEWVKNNPNPGYTSPHFDEWRDKYISFPSQYDIAKQEWLEQNNIPKWEEIAQKGGEGEGDEWYSVKYFPEHDVYIRVDGYYASHEGTSFNGWEDCTEVVPTQRTITVYESK